MRKLIETALALSLVLALAPLESASATTRHRRHHPGDNYAATARRPVVVERRSFLDPGTVVPVGAYTQYVTQPAYKFGDPPGTYQSGKYMMDTLHPTFGPNAETGGFGP